MKIFKVAALTIKQLPRQHRIALASTSLIVVAALVWQPSSPLKQTVTYQSDQRIDVEIPLEELDVLSEQNSEPMGAVLDPEDPEFLAPKDELEQQLEEVVDIAHNHKVASGETLGAIFSQYALPLADMYRLIKVNKSIQNLRVGQMIEWSVDDEGRVTEFSIKRSAKLTDLYTLAGPGYEFKKLEENGEIKPVMLTGRISGSFYQSARAAGLTPNQIQTVVQALQWRFDFGREARKGDRFAVSVEREFIDGKAVTRGDVKSLYYLSGSREVFVMRHEDGLFYDAEGKSLNRALRRIPLAKRYRISSSFNPRRKHPVTGRISPHNGTDFATPIGTPVLAAGDGVVVKARKHPLAGNYVVIKHGREYMTRYLHLHRLLVKVGDKVTMGQRIALSGNTGRSTGPHLHYELIKKNRAVNAMKVPLPQAEPISSKLRGRFVQLASDERQKLLAVMPG
ncbi:peptigoglycan-binding protein LysM [Photobacterium proteolyticum]|uniref:Peptigoglycan-binding protein LysM n=1 Tax=Photobacterium proteolyticum TaxID=1903952 RepID=A0A1Q9G5Y1_9GAMM|nr:murein DD-endopeptidase MepM [Photobacterium proteolyticum]OLQ69379.1 peptigoglycan-binding protein LysM [Photobacterium proteolyticum]